MQDSIQLLQSEKQKLADWLKSKSGSAPVCSVCGSRNWTIGDHLVTPTVTKNGNFMMGGATYPQAMVVCTNCGNTLYINAIVAGLTPPSSGASNG